jgi:Holliday junction resolvase RusA-like endonuclease
VVTDLDNRLKAVLDGLEDAGVYDNDGQIDILTIERKEQRKGGGVDVMIEVI